MVPFVRQREIVATPSQLSISRRFVANPALFSSEGWNGFQKPLEKQRAIAKTSFFDAPISKISFAIWRIFMNARRLFTAEHFLFIRIEGHKGSFKLDATGQISQDFHLLRKIVAHSSS
jgi:hypothetical protein